MFAPDILQQVFLVSDKIRVTEALLVLTVARFMEIIHVELTHKATEIVVFEVFRKHVLGKGVRVFYNEASTLSVPKNGVLVSWVLKQLYCAYAYIYNVVSFYQKIGYLLQAGVVFRLFF